MEPILFAVGAIALLTLVGGLRAEVLFRRRGLHRSGSEVWEELAAAEGELEELEEHLNVLRRDLLLQVQQYVDWHFTRWLGSLPVRSLRKFTDETIPWSALEQAGINTVEDLLQAAERLGEVRGIGTESVRRISDAFVEFREVEIGSWRPPTPDPEAEHAIHQAITMAALQLYRVRVRLLPSLQDAKQRLRKLRSRVEQGLRPLHSRWRFIRSKGRNGDAFLERAAHCLADLKDWRASDMPELTRIQGTCVLELPIKQSVREEYQEHQGAILDLMEEYFEQAVRQDSEFRWFSEGSMFSTPGVVGAGGEQDIATALTQIRDEKTFCDTIVQPLVHRWGYTALREYSVEMFVGSRREAGYADFILLNGRGDQVALIEAKARIHAPTELSRARNQALSYALWTKIQSFFVIAPQGVWSYRRTGTESELIAEYSVVEAWHAPQTVRSVLEEVNR